MLLRVERRSLGVSIDPHKLHPALRATPRVIAHDFGMHQAGVKLLLSSDLLMVVIVGVLRAIGVNRPYLCNSREDRDARNLK